MKDIILFGAGGHCYAAIELIRSLRKYDPKIIFDDDPKKSAILDVPVKQYSGTLEHNNPMYIAIGDNSNRMKVANRFNLEFPVFIHKSARIYPSVYIGRGTMVHPNVVLDAEVNIGAFCIVNNNATVSHNVRIGDYVHIAIQSAIAGGVQIGEGSLIGAGSVLVPGIKIGKWATIGAGTVVTKDVPDHAVVYGNPSRIIKINDEA